MKKLWICAACILLTVAACKKKNAAPDEVNFNNRLDKDVTLTVYNSMDDYSNGTNALLRKVIKPGAIERISATTLSYGKTYYIDWHTDNYYQNNWYNDAYPQAGAQVTIKPSQSSHDYYCNSDLKGNGRIIFLSASGTSSKWRAVDAFLFSSSTGYVSFWGSLSDAQKLHEITINKNFTAVHNYKNTAGAAATETLSFKVMRTDDAFIELKSGDSTLGSIVSGTLPTGKAPDYKSSSKDTVMALLPQSDYYFMMVRY